MKLEGLVIQNRFEEGDNFTASTFSAIGSKDGVEGYMLEPKGPTEQPNQNQRILLDVIYRAKDMIMGLFQTVKVNSTN